MGIETLAIASLAGSALSAGVGFIGAQQQASAQAASANYQAAVARNNAIIQQQNAQQAVQVGRAAAQAKDLENAQQMGAIVAAEGASGIDLGTGSPTQVRSGQQQVGRLNTLNIMQKAMNEARGFNVAAMSDTAQAQLDTMQARQAQTAGMFQAAGSLLGGATSFADKWIRFQMPGGPLA
jgi:hypothetical protein